MTARSGYIESDDSTGSHDASQLARSYNGTGNTLNVDFNTGTLVVGTQANAPSGFFPNGAYGTFQSFFEFDTTSVSGPVTDYVILKLNVEDNATLNNDGSDIFFSKYDWGSTLTGADWRTQVQTAGLTVHGQISFAEIIAAEVSYGGSGFVEVVLHPSIITTSGLTRFVAFSQLQEANTTPSDGNSSITFLQPNSIDSDFTIGAPSVNDARAGGPITGGTAVAIFGTNINTATDVKFGGVSATSFWVDPNLSNPNEAIVAITPAGSVGTVDITVVTPVATSRVTANSKFIYFDYTTATDSSSHSRDGAYLNNPLGAPSLVTGDSDKALSVTDVLQGCVQKGHFSNGLYTSATIGVLIKDLNGFFEQDVGFLSGNGQLTIGFNGNGSDPRIFFVGQEFLNTQFFLTGSTTLSSNTAYLFIGTWDGSIAKVYVNGVLDGTQSTSAFGYTDGPPGNFYVANSSRSMGLPGIPYYEGTYDEAFFIGNTAITSGNVISIWNAVQGSGSISSVISGLSPSIYWRLGELTLAGTPTVTGVSPALGYTPGGDNVVITGTNFTSTTGVTFGGVSVGSFHVDSGTQLTVTSPAHAVGVVDVVVTNTVDASTTSSSDHYTYANLTAPTVTGIAPSSGSAGGGIHVLVTGTAFNSVTGVHFGSTPATSFTVNSVLQLHAVAPAGTDGDIVHIQVTNTAGSSSTSSADLFTYTAAVPGYSGEVLIDDPLIYWRFEETSGTVAADSSGNGNDGIYMNSPVLGVPGLLADPSDLAVDIFNDNSTNIHVVSAWPPGSQVLSGFSLEALTKFHDLRHAYGYGLVSSFYDNNNDIEMAFNAQGANDNLGYWVASDTGNVNNYNAFPAVIDTLYHIVITYDGANVSFYVNGNLIESQALTGVITFQANLRGGMDGFPPGDGLNGRLDELAFYDHALTSDRVLAHFNAIDFIPSSPPPPVTTVQFPNNNAISQPQLYRLNSIIRGAEDSRNGNYELYSIAYDLYNLYYKQGAVLSAFDFDLAALLTGDLTSTDFLETATIPAYDTLLTSIVDLKRRVRTLETLARTNV